ncbi:TPA: YcaO-like family protein, partial [Streptococcus suis]
VMPIKLLLGHFEKITCLELHSLNSNKKIWYPAFLVFDSEAINDNILPSISKYLSNNGLAVGVNRNEALIHGINEVMERETLSKHFQEVFIERSIKTCNKVDFTLLPKDVIKKIKDIENTIGSSVTILDITRYDGFYTYYAFAEHKLLPIKGSGTSQYRKYAILRTLSELYQAFAMFDEEDEIINEIALKNFANIPQYKNLLLADYSAIDLINVSFVEDDFPEFSCFELLEKILGYLSGNGFSVFEFHLTTHPSIYCARVVIPEADNFQLANHGIKVIPNVLK